MRRKLLPIILPFFFCSFMPGCFLDDLCGNRTLSEATSPDGKYKAVLFQRDCGATTDFSTQISIIKKDQALPNAGANTFATGNTQDIRYHWMDNDHLVIETDQAGKIYLAKEKVGVGFWGWKKIKVRYQ